MRPVLPEPGAASGVLLGMPGVVPAEPAAHPVGLPSLFLLVVLGALVPVVPTGALVSGAAAVAVHQSAPAPALLLVLGVSASGAFVGDTVLYWLGQRGTQAQDGSRWLLRLRRAAAPDRLATAQRKLAEHGVTVLVLSRLMPAGRIPVMLASLLSGLPLRNFVRGNAPACVAWAVTYQLIGVLGGALFAEPWQGVATAVALTVLIAAGPALWRRLRRAVARPPGGPATAGPAAADGTDSPESGGRAGKSNGTCGPDRTESPGD